MSTIIRDMPSPLFQPWGLDAIRRGDKTQTRRCMKEQPPEWAWHAFNHSPGWQFMDVNGIFRDEIVYRPPHGPIGTVWYLKEGLAKYAAQTEDEKPCGDLAFYAADSEPVVSRLKQGVFAWPWKRDTLTSMFMPRFAARDFLTVTDVRVERVQDISAMDAICEGISRSHDGTHPWYKNYGPDGPANFKYLEGSTRSFASLWDSINGKKPGYSWDDNPWVWAYTFTYERDVGRAMPGGDSHGS